MEGRKERGRKKVRQEGGREGGERGRMGVKNERRGGGEGGREGRPHGCTFL